MSTLFFPRNKNRTIMVFLGFSIVLHIFAFILISSFHGFKKRNLPGLIPVQVIELPPSLRNNKEVSPQKKALLAQRTHRTKKEKKGGILFKKRDGGKGIGHTPERQGTVKSISRTKAGISAKRLKNSISLSPKKDSSSTDITRGSIPDSLQLFPSGESLAQLSRKYEKEPGGAGTGGKELWLGAADLNTNEYKYAYYINGMKRKIQLQWFYPESAIRKQIQGKLLVKFSINQKGRLYDLKLVKGSGYPVLDNAALTAIRLAAPFDPFPADFEDRKFTIHADFQYIFH